jgi:hypothetical protein
MIAESFLPTPTTADGLKMSSNPATSARRREKGNQVSLTDLVQTEMLPKGQEHWLLPTPAVNGMGSGKDPEAWNEWAARQKSADGRPAPHGKSLEQEALTMLPTPRSRLEGNQHYKGRDKGNLEDIPELFGESTPLQSDDGKLF